MAPTQSHSRLKKYCRSKIFQNCKNIYLDGPQLCTPGRHNTLVGFHSNLAHPNIHSSLLPRIKETWRLPGSGMNHLDIYHVTHRSINISRSNIQQNYEKEGRAAPADPWVNTMAAISMPQHPEPCAQTHGGEWDGAEDFNLEQMLRYPAKSPIS